MTIQDRRVSDPRLPRKQAAGSVHTRDTTPNVDAASMVIFGITGDLARRKVIPALYDLAYSGQLPRIFNVIGFARKTQRIEQLLQESVITHARTPFELDVWQTLSDRLHIVHGSADEPAAFNRLAAQLRHIDDENAALATRGSPSKSNYVFYLSVPPSVFPTICHQLAATELTRSQRGWRRVIVEKPFGHNLASSLALEGVLADTFDPASVYRIDHYLGKEAVQNILALRFGNGLFEPLWNNRYIDHIQITMAETVGVGGRASYYDGVGAARDVIQNHLLQLLALIAMDEPTSFNVDAITAEKVKALSATELLGPLEETTAHGQYSTGIHSGDRVPGLTEESGFPRDSRTETYAALTLAVQNRRWAGVPIFVRTGKRLARRKTEVAIAFSAPVRRRAILEATDNLLVIRVQPDDGIEVHLGMKRPGSGMALAPVALGANSSQMYEAAPGDYERLIGDVFRGDARLFPSRQEIESSWRIIDPAIDHWKHTGRPESYAAGSAGPPGADVMLQRTGRTWRPL